jgi:hypothetical protein
MSLFRFLRFRNKPHTNMKFYVPDLKYTLFKIQY